MSTSTRTADRLTAATEAVTASRSVARRGPYLEALKAKVAVINELIAEATDAESVETLEGIKTHTQNAFRDAYFS